LEPKENGSAASWSLTDHVHVVRPKPFLARPFHFRVERDLPLLPLISLSRTHLLCQSFASLTLRSLHNSDDVNMPHKSVQAAEKAAIEGNTEEWDTQQCRALNAEFEALLVSDLQAPIDQVKDPAG